MGKKESPLKAKESGITNKTNLRKILDRKENQIILDVQKICKKF